MGHVSDHDRSDRSLRRKRRGSTKRVEIKNGPSPLTNLIYKTSFLAVTSTEGPTTSCPYQYFSALHTTPIVALYLRPINISNWIPIATATSGVACVFRVFPFPSRFAFPASDALISTTVIIAALALALTLVLTHGLILVPGHTHVTNKARTLLRFTLTK